MRMRLPEDSVGETYDYDYDAGKHIPHTGTQTVMRIYRAYNQPQPLVQISRYQTITLSITLHFCIQRTFKMQPT